MHVVSVCVQTWHAPSTMLCRACWQGGWCERETGTASLGSWSGLRPGTGLQASFARAKRHKRGGLAGRTCWCSRLWRGPLAISRMLCSDAVFGCCVADCVQPQQKKPGMERSGRAPSAVGLHHATFACLDLSVYMWSECVQTRRVLFQSTLWTLAGWPRGSPG